MNPNDYDVYFNIAREPFTGWFPGVLFLLIAAGFVGARIVERERVYYIGAFFAGVLAAGLLGLTYYDYAELRGEFDAGRVWVVEGHVNSFQPNSPVMHQDEVFTIGDRSITLSGSDITAGFNETYSAGGPNFRGQCLRGYFASDHADFTRIVWLGRRKRGCADDGALRQHS